MSIRNTKCRVTFEYDEELARAVANRYGWDKPATHSQMRSHFEEFGVSTDDDLLWELRTGTSLDKEQ